jgi:hypothetical protein
MRQIFCWIAGGLITASGWAQGGAIVEARQGEVERLAEAVYGIQLRQGQWTHSVISACPAFRRHAFARYERQDAREAFMAIYDLDVPPAKQKGKPWLGGIVLLPLYGAHRGEQEKPVASSDAAVADFNKVWLDERSHQAHPDIFPDLTWSGVAGCYARIVGDQPLADSAMEPNSSGIETQAPGIAFDLQGEKVSDVLLPLVGTATTKRTMYVMFDANGLVTEAGVSVTPALK